MGHGEAASDPETNQGSFRPAPTPPPAENFRAFAAVRMCRSRAEPVALAFLRVERAVRGLHREGYRERSNSYEPTWELLF